MKHLFSIALFLSASAVFAKPTVIVDSTVQNGDGSVTINYKLSGEPAIVCFDIQTNSVSVGGRNLRRVAGDVNRIVALKHDFATPYAGTIRWFPYGTELGRGGFALDASVTAQVSAYATNCPPAYMTVNIGLPNNYWPTASRGYGLRFYPDAESLPGGLESPRYRESVVVMRKIPATDVVWRHGAPNDNTWPTRSSNEFNYYVKLTNDFYIGVFPVTHCQMMAIRSVDGTTRTNYESMSDFNAAAASQVNYNNMRESSSNKRVTAAVPSAGSILGQLRKRMGVAFDLPTSLEWEFACRAGTKGPIYNSDTWDLKKLDKIAWTINNQPRDASGNLLKFTHPVGLLDPNAWGLYDMIGNQWDMCLDFCPSPTEQFAALGGKGWKVDDPAIHPVLLSLASNSSSTNRCRLAGSYTENANQCRVSNRSSAPVTSGWSALRLYCRAEF